MRGVDLLAAVDAPINRRASPDSTSFGALIRAACGVLSRENPALRPRSASGEPGGLLCVTQPRVILVPDIHARAGLLAALLRASAAPLGFGGKTIADLAAEGEVGIVCLGDVMHSEGHEAAKRWRLAARYMRCRRHCGDSGYTLKTPPPGNSPMDEEMRRSLAALEAVMGVKILIPENFHCLKGNHDNAGNAGDHGDFPFFKYAREGEMTAEWLVRVYGGEMVRELRKYELLLPLVAVGKAFCASHAEPAVPLNRDAILGYGSRPDVVQALIWTGNGEAEDKAAERTMAELLGKNPAKTGARWFSGHRPVTGFWATRADGLVIQIHNPGKMQFVWIDNSRETLPACLMFLPRGDGELTLAGKIS